MCTAQLGSGMMLCTAACQQDTAPKRSKLKEERRVVVVKLDVRIVFVYLSARLHRCCSHGVYIWTLDVGTCWELEIDGDGERMEGEEVNGIRFGGIEKQRLPEMLLDSELSVRWLQRSNTAETVKCNRSDESLAA